MVRTFLLCALAASAGCSFGDDRSLGGDGGGQDARTDGMTDGPVMAKDHLLLSEVKSVGPEEFIEIWNPTSRPISLANYYLADYNEYWKLPSNPSPTIAQNDFLAQLPSNATLAAGQVATVAMLAADFMTKYSRAATYSLDAVSGAQKLERVIGAANSPTITNGGEIVVLFYWNGQTDLVQDVDIIMAGPALTVGEGNYLSVKGTVDGPDADTTGSTYKTDSNLLGGGMMGTAAGDNSYKRIKLETGAETQTDNGNGLTGDDETSENLKVTWDGVSPAYSVANPGVAPTI